MDTSRAYPEALKPAEPMAAAAAAAAPPGEAAAAPDRGAAGGGGAAAAAGRGQRHAGGSLSRAERIGVGQKCKQLIDQGRLEWLRQQGFQVSKASNPGPQVRSCGRTSCGSP